MRNISLIFFILLSCSSIPSEYVKRVEKMEREVAELRKEMEMLRKKAQILRDSLRKSEEYESQIRNFVNEYYRKKGSPILPPKVK